MELDPRKRDRMESLDRKSDERMEALKREHREAIRKLLEEPPGGKDVPPERD